MCNHGQHTPRVIIYGNLDNASLKSNYSYIIDIIINIPADGRELYYTCSPVCPCSTSIRHRRLMK